MLFARKNRWARIAFSLLTTGILVQGSLRSMAGSDFNKDKVTPFVIKDEIKKMQETLRNKGHYRGPVDGVFGLQTRAGIREYQEVKNLPITGQVDARTADGLGVRPESTWGNSENTGREVWHSGDKPVGEIKRDKPSAGIARTEGSARKTPRKEVSKATATEDNRRDEANK
jgi:peptidoglycan hydrolase-like protein with peptidoglycan-binding domain